MPWSYIAHRLYEMIFPLNGSAKKLQSLKSRIMYENILLPKKVKVLNTIN